VNRREKDLKLVELYQARAEGKTIQFQSVNDLGRTSWDDVPKACSLNSTHRIKPEPVLFDITLYKMSDPNTLVTWACEKPLTIGMEAGPLIHFQPEDIQAMAKHFYQRAEDKAAFIEEITGE
jgi:hypothetical protein